MDIKINHRHKYKRKNKTKLKQIFDSQKQSIKYN